MDTHLLSHTRGAALAFAAAATAAPATPPAWPVVAAFSQRVTLEASRHVLLPIKDARGQALYVLDCGAAGDAVVHCRLDEPKLRADSLLGSTGLRDRGVFQARDLQGACAAYPQFGRQRSFRLRGFELTLALLDLPAASAGAPVRHALQVDVQADALARSARAEAPEPPDPQSAGHGCQAPPPPVDPFSCKKPEVEITQPTCTQ
ncbi:MAG: hypothetical protein RL684_1794 [Pseudomonadota bacterium]|jgi:hypothetical protein